MPRGSRARAAGRVARDPAGHSPRAAARGRTRWSPRTRPAARPSRPARAGGRARSATRFRASSGSSVSRNWQEPRHANIVKANPRIIKRSRVEAFAALCYKHPFTVTMSKSSTIPAVRGFRDVLPEECAHWQRLEAAARDLFARDGFGAILLPLYTRTQLFAGALCEPMSIPEKGILPSRLPD